jgi:hypothetical protein
MKNLSTAARALTRALAGAVTAASAAAALLLGAGALDSGAHTNVQAGDLNWDVTAGSATPTTADDGTTDVSLDDLNWD